MDSVSKLSCFTTIGDKFAHTGADGVVRIWNTASGILEQEYQPSEHLSASISCVRFAPQRKKSSKSKKKKNKDQDEGGGMLLALGTAAGSIILYSLQTHEVQKVLKHSESSPIVDICWLSFKTLVSFAEDKFLAHWNVKTGDRIRHIATKGGSSFAMLGEQTVVIGDRSIEVLEIVSSNKNPKSSQVLSSFTGHSTAVMKICPVQVEPSGSPQYFLSTAQDDRFIYAWSVQGKSDPITSFMAKDKVQMLAVSEPINNNVHLAVTTGKGLLKVFSHRLNGKSSKAEGSVASVILKCEDDPNRKLPVLSVHFCNNLQASLIIVYGFSSLLTFEKLNFKELKGDVELVRKDPNAKVVPRKSALVKTVTPHVNRDSKLLAPGHLSTVSSAKSKRKRDEDQSTNELPMEERLNALALDRPTQGDGTAPPRADNLAQLLLQGLHSQDSTLLANVLYRGDEELVSNTVRRLPVTAVVPLLNTLQALIRKKGPKNIAYILWVRQVLYHHMSHLSTIPDREELVKPFYCLCAAHLAVLPEVTQLHARLDLMLTHVTTRHQDANKQAPAPEALLIYKDESSDEDEILADVGVVSESEDNWEDWSGDEADVNGLYEEEDSDMEVEDDQRINAIKRSLEDDEDVEIDLEDSGDEEEGALVVDSDEEDDDSD